MSKPLSVKNMEDEEEQLNELKVNIANSWRWAEAQINVN